MQTRPLSERRFFQQFLSDFYGMRRALWGRRADAWQPPTDVYETDRHIVVKMSIPGVKPGQIRVHCNGEVITITGVREGPDPAEVRSYHQMEIRNGYFERSIAIHEPFDPREAHAQYVDGFLYVSIPKAPESVRHVVSIRLGV